MLVSSRMGEQGAGDKASGGGLPRTYVIRSFLSFSFFRPPKAILVPGMYFLGFSRYSNCRTSCQPWPSSCEDDGVAWASQLTRVSSFHSIPFCLLASV
jgi:hypothetical protein